MERHIIFCEGATDSLVLNKFLCSKEDVKFLNGKEKKEVIKNMKYEISILLKNQEIVYLGNKDKLFILYNIGGIGNLKKCIGEVEKLFKNNSNIDKISILTDKDNKEIKEIELECNSYFLNKIALKNNKRIKYSFKDSFEEEKEIQILLLIVPIIGKGALETLLLETLKNKSYSNRIVAEKIENTIDELSNEDIHYLKKIREQIKSKLGACVNIYDPERTFKDILEVLDGIDWGKYNEINDIFNNIIS